MTKTLTPEEVEALAAEERTKIELLERLERIDAEQAEASREALDELSVEDLRAMVEVAEVGQALEDGPDGSIVVRLEAEVALPKGGSRSKIAVRAVRVRDLRVASRAIDRGDGEVYAFADELVEPKGAHLEIRHGADWQAVRMAVDRQLGKFFRTGRASS